MSGATTRWQNGVYGTQGVPAAGNVPGARAFSVSWVDAAGDLWLFGGEGYDSVGGSGNLNDLWRYSTATGQWTWMSGATTINQFGVYGTQGVPAPTNVPGARYNSLSWVDAAGDLWLFGGRGYDGAGGNGRLNDLWRYSTATGQWTWMSGIKVINQWGVYGTQGVEAAGNVPGVRQGNVSWVDAAGDLWLFGGYGYASAGGLGYLNDLWRYSMVTGQWTWMSGANVHNQAGVYGAQGVEAAGNAPGARRESISWVDAGGDLWLFGGSGYDSAGSLSTLNDLWRYSPATGQWAWMGGANVVNQDGVYGTQGVEAAGNVPGARSGSISWVDAGGDLWLFGGYGHASAGSPGRLNDLWRYNLPAAEVIYLPLVVRDYS
jgi:N-acetylneuraminic acid mutarotase